MRLGLCGLLLLLVVSCGRLNRPNPTPPPVTVVVTATPSLTPLPAPHPAAMTPVPTTDSNTVAVDLISGTPWAISVDAGGILFEAELHAGGGELTVDETGIGSSGGLMRVERLQVRPITVNTPNDVTNLVPMVTSTVIRPNAVDNPMCDVVYFAPYISGGLCRQFKAFDIDTRCLNQFELAVALDAAGWPAEALEAAVLEFRQESNGCVNAIDSSAVGIAGIHWLGHTVTGWDRGTPRYPEFADLNPYDVDVNLQLALRIWEDSGWDPWRGGNRATPTATSTRRASAEPITPTLYPTNTPIPATPTATQTPSAECPETDATLPGNQTGVLSEACAVARATGCDDVQKIDVGWLCLSWRGRPVLDVVLSAEDFAVLPGANGMSAEDVELFTRACSCVTGCRLGWISGTARERGPWGINIDWLRKSGVEPNEINMYEPNNAIALARRLYDADGGFFRWPASCVEQ